MDISSRIVLAETDPARFLRFVLEGEGLPVIGLASDDDELRRVLRGVRPAVVVVDAGIAAATALQVREDHPDAFLIVVWPPGIAAVLAHEHVEPDRIVEDLGDAVRRGLASADEREAEHRRELEEIGLPPHLRRLLAKDEAPPPVPAASRPPPIGRARHAIALSAAVWVLTLAVATAMAASAPSAIRFIREFGRPASERTAPVTAASPSARASDATEDGRDAPEGAKARRDSERRCGDSDHRSGTRGCSGDRRQDGGKSAADGHDPDAGRKPEGTPGHGKPDGTPGGGKPEGAGKNHDHGKPEGTPGGGKPEGGGKPVSEPAGGGRSAARSERPRH